MSVVERGVSQDAYLRADSGEGRKGKCCDEELHGDARLWDS